MIGNSKKLIGSMYNRCRGKYNVQVASARRLLVGSLLYDTPLCKNINQVHNNWCANPEYVSFHIILSCLIRSLDEPSQNNVT